jgi:hypothetical protein
MPKPKQWVSRGALIRDLAKYPWKTHFEPTTVSLVVRQSVGANTFRAFQRLPKKPSVVFRDWGVGALETRGFLDRLRSVKSQDAYDGWLDDLVVDFRAVWKRAMGGAISFGPSRKLPNLVTKTLIESPLLPDQIRERIVWYLHVPLDSYTIQAVTNCSDKSGDQIGKIPKSATMRFVESQLIYDALQKRIRSLADEARVPPIALDYLAWNASH